MTEYPDEYPDRLKKISWVFDGNDGPIAGPMKYYTRYLPYETKGDSLFVTQVLYDYFAKNKVTHEQCKDIVNYFVKCFTVWYTTERGEFVISQKKDKETKKPIFNEDEWHKACKYSKKSDSIKMLKLLAAYVKQTYDNLLGG